MKEEDTEIININPRKSSKSYKIHFNENEINKSPSFQALNPYPACRLKKAVRFTKKQIETTLLALEQLEQDILKQHNIQT